MTTDFIAKQTAKNLAEFACMFEVEPYVVYRGWFYTPLLYGSNERPAYRKSWGWDSKGYIVTAWDNGKVFKNQADRNRAFVRILDSDVMDLLAQGKRDEALARARKCI